MSPGRRIVPETTAPPSGSSSPEPPVARPCSFQAPNPDSVRSAHIPTGDSMKIPLFVLTLALALPLSAQNDPASRRAAERELLRELIEINTAPAAGSTKAAEAMGRPPAHRWIPRGRSDSRRSPAGEAEPRNPHARQERRRSHPADRAPRCGRRASGRLGRRCESVPADRARWLLSMAAELSM